MTKIITNTMEGITDRDEEDPASQVLGIRETDLISKVLNKPLPGEIVINDERIPIRSIREEHLNLMFNKFNRPWLSREEIPRTIRNNPELMQELFSELPDGTYKIRIDINEMNHAKLPSYRTVVEPYLVKDMIRYVLFERPAKQKKEYEYCFQALHENKLQTPVTASHPSGTYTLKYSTDGRFMIYRNDDAHPIKVLRSLDELAPSTILPIDLFISMLQQYIAREYILPTLNGAAKKIIKDRPTLDIITTLSKRLLTSRAKEDFQRVIMNKIHEQIYKAFGIDEDIYIYLKHILELNGIKIVRHNGRIIPCKKKYIEQVLRRGTNLEVVHALSVEKTNPKFNKEGAYELARATYQKIQDTPGLTFSDTKEHRSIYANIELSAAVMLELLRSTALPERDRLFLGELFEDLIMKYPEFFPEDGPEIKKIEKHYEDLQAALAPAVPQPAGRSPTVKTSPADTEDIMAQLHAEKLLAEQQAAEEHARAEQEAIKAAQAAAEKAKAEAEKRKKEEEKRRVEQEATIKEFCEQYKISRPLFDHRLHDYGNNLDLTIRSFIHESAMDELNFLRSDHHSSMFYTLDMADFYHLDNDHSEFHKHYQNIERLYQAVYNDFCTASAPCEIPAQHEALIQMLNEHRGLSFDRRTNLLTMTEEISTSNLRKLIAIPAMTPYTTLLNTLYNDSHLFTFRSIDKAVDRLNTIIADYRFLRIFLNKGFPLPKDEDFVRLYNDTKEYQGLPFTSFDRHKQYEQKGYIKLLHRRLLKALYPVLCPECEFPTLAEIYRHTKGDRHAFFAQLNELKETMHERRRIKQELWDKWYQSLPPSPPPWVPPARLSKENT